MRILRVIFVFITMSLIMCTCLPVSLEPLTCETVCNAAAILVVQGNNVLLSSVF